MVEVWFVDAVLAEVVSLFPPAVDWDVCVPAPAPACWPLLLRGPVGEWDFRFVPPPVWW